MKKIIHLLVAGSLGGIENLSYNSSHHSRHDNVYVFVWNDGYYADKLKEEGKKVYSLKEFDSSITKIRKVLEIVKKEKADVVISHHSAPLFKLLIKIIEMAFKNISTICYAHANAADICEHKKKGLLLRKFVHKIGFDACDGVIAISNSVKNSLIEYLSVSEKKIEVIYNGVPLKNFQDIEKNPEKNIHLLYVGRLTKEKGIHKTIRSLAFLPDDCDFRFMIVGDGPYKKELEAFVEELSLNEKVIFTGPKQDIREFLAKSHLFVHLPEWEEGFGITVVEAMASGLICVCNSKGALPEIIDNNRNGLIIDDVSSAEISSQLLDIIKNYYDNKYEELLKNAKKDVLKYSVEEYSKLLDEYIDRICSRKEQHE